MTNAKTTARRVSKPSSDEVRQRALRLVREQGGAHDTEWAAIRAIAEKIGCTDGLAFLTDKYQDSLGGNGWSVARDATLSYVGASVDVSLERVLRGENTEPPPATRLTARDSSRVAQLSSWLWQRRCTEGREP